jgi:cell division protein FtsL
MFYGFLMAASVAVPFACLFACDIKNRKRIVDLQQQIQSLKVTVSQQNDEMNFLKNSSEAKIAYNILKDNCRKMGTCHLFK